MGSAFRRQRPGRVLLLALGIDLLLVREAQAYVDPGTASFIFQAVLAALLGALLGLKNTWRRLFARRERNRPASEARDDES